VELGEERRFRRPTGVDDARGEALPPLDELVERGPGVELLDRLDHGDQFDRHLGAVSERGRDGYRLLAVMVMADGDDDSLEHGYSSRGAEPLSSDDRPEANARARVERPRTLFSDLR
jgi:hypothetical protein